MIDAAVLERTHVHGRGSEGERHAAARASRGASEIWRQILEAIGKAGPNGLTPDEFAEATGMLINTVRRRFTDLWKAGHIRHHIEGLHRPNAAGNPCRAWMLGADPNREASRRSRPAPLSLEQIRALEAPLALQMFAPRGFDSVVDLVRAVERAHRIGVPR